MRVQAATAAAASQEAQEALGRELHAVSVYTRAVQAARVRMVSTTASVISYLEPYPLKPYY